MKEQTSWWRTDLAPVLDTGMSLPLNFTRCSVRNASSLRQCWSKMTDDSQPAQKTSFSTVCCNCLVIMLTMEPWDLLKLCILPRTAARSQSWNAVLWSSLNNVSSTSAKITENFSGWTKYLIFIVSVTNPWYKATWTGSVIVFFPCMLKRITGTLIK